MGETTDFRRKAGTLALDMLIDLSRLLMTQTYEQDSEMNAMISEASALAAWGLELGPSLVIQVRAGCRLAEAATAGTQHIWRRVYDVAIKARRTSRRSGRP